MSQLFQMVNARLKTVVLRGVAAELEDELILAWAQRKRELLRQATLLEREGLSDLAHQLRHQAESLEPRALSAGPADPTPTELPPPEPKPDEDGPSKKKSKG